MWDVGGPQHGPPGTMMIVKEEMSEPPRGVLCGSPWFNEVFNYFERFLECLVPHTGTLAWRN